MSLARLRAQGLTLELDLRDLRFSPDESERFLRTQLGAISRRDALDLHERSDGWVAGLQLLAIARKQGRPSDAAPLDTPEPARGHVQEPQAFSSFFEREVLARLSPAELDVLISASACTRFCAPLCAALIERPDAVAEVLSLLTRLEADNLFIVPVDSADHDTWWRLHPLLRETLLERLHRRSPAHRQRVHHAAWHWFREHGLLDEAVRQAVQAGEFDAAADWIEQSATQLALQGGLRKIVALVRLLPPAQIHARHRLRLWMVRVDLYTRNFSACAAGIEALRGDIPAHDPDSGYMLTLVHAMLALQRDDIATVQQLLPQLRNAPATADAMTLGGRDNIVSWLHLHLGEYAMVRELQKANTSRLMNGAPLLGTASGSLQGQCLIGLSHALQGHIAQAEQAYRGVLQRAERAGTAGHDPHNLATALLGEVLYELNDAQGVLHLLEPRVELLERVSIPDAAMRLLGHLGHLGHLAMAHGVLGNDLESMAYLERLEDYAQNLGLPRLLAHSLGAQIRHHLRLGNQQAADALMQRLGQLDKASPSPSQTCGEIALTTARARVAWLLAQRRPDEANQLITPLIDWVQRAGRQRVLAQLLLAHAAIALQQNQPALARERVLAALTLGHRLGLVRSVLDASPAVLALVRSLALDPSLDPVLAFYAERLTLATQATHAVAASAALALPAVTGASLATLSEREMDVVTLLAQAMPNKKIARALSLSPETVKWHLKNIYGKLGVATRDEAVARVRDLQR